MRTRVKICGITTLSDALAACEAGADALGFNFAPEAKPKGRYVEPSEARRIIERLPPFVSTVAVTVNESAARLKEYLEFVDLVQLHGEESPVLCAELSGRVIKAFRLRPGFSFDSVLSYRARAYLVDAYVPQARGGTGQVCDWEMAKGVVRLGQPVILAGGLTPENVEGAVREVRPYGVDVAGGVEQAPGKKDYERLRIFVQRSKLAGE